MKKVCTKCGIEKLTSDYSIRSDSGKSRNECKKCMIAKSKKWRLDNIKHCKNRDKEYYYEHWDEKQLQRKKWIENNKDKHRLIVREAIFRFNARNPDKIKAYQSVLNAIRSGRLIVPNKCEKCGIESKLEGHHHNGYDEENKLNLQWLCRQCHGHTRRKYV